MVGGESVHLTANYWRFHEEDFEERGRWGNVPGASLADWPIRYPDLEPYYTKAEYDLGVSGLAGASPFDPPRSKPYPLPPLPVKSSGVIFEHAARKLGLHPFPAPMANLFRNFRGRQACQHCGLCNSFGCEFGSKSSTLVAVIPSALQIGRCEIRAESYVRKIETRTDGRVTGVVYSDKRREEVFQRARAVVLCANGADPKRGFFGGGGIDARSMAYPITFALFGLPDDAPRWGAAYKKMPAEYFTRTMVLLAHTTRLPQETNSITLDPELRDAWGLPAIRVTFSLHADDVKTLWFCQEREVEILEAAKAQRVWTIPPNSDLLPSRHLMGTCRMGHDPKTSVVDANNRSYDVPNLFIVDGSSLVTSGRQQPTATIQALAYRAGERIAELARKGEV